ncbi:MAG: septum formation initiator family protein [Flavobacterium sp.]|nr:septum formation initiator family protein [Flavobacterium sp.]
MKQIIPIITNRYLLAIVFFAVWMCFFDQRDIFNTINQKQKLKALETKKHYYQTEIEKAKQDLNNLQNSPEALEKFAREKYLMKKNGEDIFIIEDTTATKNSYLSQ